MQWKTKISLKTLSEFQQYTFMWRIKLNMMQGKSLPYRASSSFETT